MILVTVGTHEQSFERLLREIDRLVAIGEIDGEVFCQTGFSDYEPATPSAAMLDFADMQQRLARAKVVVSHGGPGTVLAALAAGRPLVLVPRQRRFGEHVDDHQVAFCRRIGADRGVPVVEDIGDLSEALRSARDAGPRVAGGDVEPTGVRRLGELIDGLFPQG